VVIWNIAAKLLLVFRCFGEVGWSCKTSVKVGILLRLNGKSQLVIAKIEAELRV